MKPQSKIVVHDNGQALTEHGWLPELDNPYGQPGDRLWVKETHWRWGKWLMAGQTKTGRQRWWFKSLNRLVKFETDRPFTTSGVNRSDIAWHKRPSLFMPRWASHLTLDILRIRVERVQDITPADCAAEGLSRGDDGSWLGPLDGTPGFPYAHAHEAYAGLWDTLNAERGFGWDKNPWVWVIEFTVQRPARSQSPAPSSA